MIIRLFKDSDLPQIVHLFTEAVHTINKKDYSAEQLAVWAPELPDYEKWHKRLRNLIVYVAHVDTILVGFISMSHDGILDHLYIHPGYQGGRIALALFRKIIEKAKQLGLTTVTTYCSITAKKPAEFMGFVVIKEQQVIRNGICLINYMMQKKLT